MADDSLPNIPSSIPGSGIVQAGEKILADTGSDAGIGAGIGAPVPIIGPILGGLIGGAYGLISSVLKVGAMKGPFTDQVWDLFGTIGGQTKEANGSGLNISGAQQAFVNSIAAGIKSQPGWLSIWPATWNTLAHGTQTESTLLANAVGRAVGAPTGQSEADIEDAMKALSALQTSAANSIANSIRIANQAAAAQAAAANPLAISRAAANQAFNEQNLTTSNIAASVKQAAASGAAVVGLGGGGPNMFAGIPIATPAQLAQIASGQAVVKIGNIPVSQVILPAAHQVVAAAAAGNTDAQNTVMNSISAARSPAANAQQTALADTLALAQKIQTHAKYVQKWFGPAAAQTLLTGHYLTTANLGS